MPSLVVTTTFVVIAGLLAVASLRSLFVPMQRANATLVDSFASDGRARAQLVEPRTTRRRVAVVDVLDGERPGDTIELVYDGEWTSRRLDAVSPRVRVERHALAVAALCLAAAVSLVLQMPHSTLARLRAMYRRSFADVPP